MSLRVDTGRARSAYPGVKTPRPPRRCARGPRFDFATVATAAATIVVLSLAAPANGSAPATFDSQPEDLSMLTAEMAADDPLAVEARCRSFLTALYHRLRAQGINPEWDPAAKQTDPLDWVLDAFSVLAPASAGVRAADAAAGDLTRAYLDAFGPGARPSSLPDDPLYLNDKTICEGVLGLARE